MDMDATIKGRRSIRKYQLREVPDSLVEELLLLATYAPSSMNAQPWFFVIIKNHETKKRLVEIKNRHCPPEKRVYRADFLQEAPLVIVVCVDKEQSYDREVENAVLAAANIMLAACQRGLGSVYMSAYRADDQSIAQEIRQVLGIPESVDPITIIPLGYPDETPEPKVVKALEEIVFYEAFGKKQTSV